MNFNVIATEVFERKLKRLAKKHRSLKNDYKEFYKSLEAEPEQGILLTENCYKVRLAIKSKGRGKSGGARIITYIISEDKNIFLLDIYDKSDQESISDSRLKELIDLVKNY